MSRDWLSAAQRRIGRWQTPVQTARIATIARLVHAPTLRLFGAGRDSRPAMAVALPRSLPMVLRLRRRRQVAPGPVLTLQNETPIELSPPETEAPVPDLGGYTPRAPEGESRPAATRGSAISRVLRRILHRSVEPSDDARPAEGGPGTSRDTTTIGSPAGARPVEVKRATAPFGLQTEANGGHEIASLEREASLRELVEVTAEVETARSVYETAAADDMPAPGDDAPTAANDSVIDALPVQDWGRSRPGLLPVLRMVFRRAAISSEDAPPEVPDAGPSTQAPIGVAKASSAEPASPEVPVPVSQVESIRGVALAREVAEESREVRQTTGRGEVRRLPAVLRRVVEREPATATETTRPSAASLATMAPSVGETTLRGETASMTHSVSSGVDQPEAPAASGVWTARSPGGVLRRTPGVAKSTLSTEPSEGESLSSAWRLPTEEPPASGEAAAGLVAPRTGDVLIEPPEAGPARGRLSFLLRGFVGGNDGVDRGCGESETKTSPETGVWRSTSLAAR